MDYDKLINELNDWNEYTIVELCGTGKMPCQTHCDNEHCIVSRAATALEASWHENQALRGLVNGLDAELSHVRADLSRVTAERDAAQALLAERSGVTGSAPITTAFGVPLERIRELVEADREGRCVVLPEGGYEDKDGENALKSAMHTCFYHNDPVTRFIADAVAEKLTRQDAQAALRREQDG